jgi:VRR-NUC domain.
MLEKEIEKYLVKRVKELGGRAYKFVSSGNDGVPDRLVCLPGGRVMFVELKAPGKTPTALQRAQIAFLNNLGFVASYATSCEEVDFILSGYDHK